MGGTIDYNEVASVAEQRRRDAERQVHEVDRQNIKTLTAELHEAKQKLKELQRTREEIAAQLLASIEEVTMSAVGNTRIFLTHAPDGSEIAIAPQHIEGILEAVAHEWKKHQKFSYIEAAEQASVSAREEAKNWRKKYEEIAARRFPILNEGFPECPSSIPWFAIDRWERQVMSNHGQSLEELAKRGGVDPTELWFIVQGRKYDHNEPDLVAKSVTLVKKFNGIDVEWLRLYEELLAHHESNHPECKL